jgi:hypothetical protein
MRIRRTTTTIFAALFLTAAIGAPLPAAGYGNGTPDGQPPAEEPVCDNAGLERAAFGLCIMFCEASDCDLHPTRSSCRILRRNYHRLTGESLFPCEMPEGGDGSSFYGGS